jgi:hypothetical protein
MENYSVNSSNVINLLGKVENLMIVGDYEMVAPDKSGRLVVQHKGNWDGNERFELCFSKPNNRFRELFLNVYLKYLIK